MVLIGKLEKWHEWSLKNQKITFLVHVLNTYNQLDPCIIYNSISSPPKLPLAHFTNQPNTILGLLTMTPLLLAQLQIQPVPNINNKMYITLTIQPTPSSSLVVLPLSKPPPSLHLCNTFSSPSKATLSHLPIPLILYKTLPTTLYTLAIPKLTMKVLAAKMN